MCLHKETYIYIYVYAIQLLQVRAMTNHKYRMFQPIGCLSPSQQMPISDALFVSLGWFHPGAALMTELLFQIYESNWSQHDHGVGPSRSKRKSSAAVRPLLDNFRWEVFAIRRARAQNHQTVADPADLPNRCNWYSSSTGSNWSNRSNRSSWSTWCNWSKWST